MTQTAQRYLYYPGCSLRGTGKAYEESLLAVMEELGVEIAELDDWNCCGATAYMAVDEAKSFALAGRNLALAERSTGDLIAPCSACYLVLKKAQHCLAESSTCGERVAAALATAGLKQEGKVNVRHPLDVLVNDIGLDALKSRVRKPLRGLRVATYYGCQLVRPYAEFDDADEPVAMDQLLRAVGAETVDFPLKTKCCGGSLTGTVPNVGLSLAKDILREAKRRDAALIATVCPLCQFNLEAYQDRMKEFIGDSQVPVLYFTQLLGLAMGISPRKLGLQRCIVPPDPALASMGGV